MKSVITPVKKRNEYFIFTKFSQGRFLLIAGMLFEFFFFSDRSKEIPIE